MQPIDIESVVRRAVLCSYPMRDGQARTIVVQLPSRPLYVSADPEQLATAIVELIAESAEGSGCDARILVSIEHERGKTVLRVRESQRLRERSMRLVPALAPLAAGTAAVAIGDPFDR